MKKKNMRVLKMMNLCFIVVRGAELDYMAEFFTRHVTIPNAKNMIVLL